MEAIDHKNGKDALGKSLDVDALLRRCAPPSLHEDWFGKLLDSYCCHEQTRNQNLSKDARSQGHGTGR